MSTGSRRLYLRAALGIGAEEHASRHRPDDLPPGIAGLTDSGAALADTGYVSHVVDHRGIATAPSWLVWVAGHNDPVNERSQPLDSG